jgi:transcriptional regulator with XRE-family HTH domain
MKPEPIYKEIGGIIRRLRRRHDLPQEKLANQLRIARATLANIETGRQRILVHQLYAIAQVLKVKLSDLLPELPEKLDHSELEALNFNGDLSIEQRKQVANLIGAVNVSPPPSGK